MAQLGLLKYTRKAARKFCDATRLTNETLKVR
jgi:hypothetical protein